MTLIVCSLSDMPGVVRRRRASHLVTLIDPGTPVERPLSVPESRHLRLDFDDIDAPAEGYRAPDAASVARMLEFSRAWDASAPMVVHCFAGISRSTASAFAIACDRNPDVPESQIALTLRQAARHAFPNRRIVALADDMLGRHGRMVEAIEAIGGNGFVPSGVPFDLPVRF
ncbi:MAG TPA: protein-tyrosine phosphatase family protein [Caulobacteraceae bacterium]|jgi:predicted protein tyrosine phosphatase|nr:protein-tyrosine phosphatase family protein [Caulobacteraceae bacterium]